MPGVGVQAPEDIDEADLVEDMAQPAALLGSEAGILLILAPVR